MIVDIQKACETLEDLLQRDIKMPVLKITEFLALNEVLFELTVNGKYDCREGVDE